MGRRLYGLAPEAEQENALLGQRIVKEVKPEASHSEVSAFVGGIYKTQVPKWRKSFRHNGRHEDLVLVGSRNVESESQWSDSGHRGWVQGYGLFVQGLAFPEPVPIFAAWRPKNENEGDETSISFYIYEEDGGLVLRPKQLFQERHSLKDDASAYRKETIELLFQLAIQALGLKKCQFKGEGRDVAFVLAGV